jgi:hypothetical protein
VLLKKKHHAAAKPAHIFHDRSFRTHSVAAVFGDFSQPIGGGMRACQ